MKTIRPFLPLLLALSVFGCLSEPETGSPYTTSLVNLEGMTFGESHRVLLIVADDADTTEGAQIRDKLTQSLRQSLQQEIDERWGSCGSNDPAQWHPGDMRVVVARPSAPDNEAMLTWLDIPNLAWITNTSRTEEIDAVVNAATEALSKRLAAPGEVYRPLHTAKRAVDLVLGARAPENDQENQFITSLAPSFMLQVFLGNTRADEDQTPISQLLPASSMNQNIYVAPYAIIGPSLGGDTICNVYPLGSSRLESWTKQTDGYFIAWPCDYQNTWDQLMFGGWADCGPVCRERPIVTDSAGSAQCKIFIEQPDLERCDPDRGWRDPEGKATFTERNTIKLRRCEIVQHTGAKLEACRHSLECTDCGGGFCLTEVPELVPPQSYCLGSDVPWPLRYTGGAIAADGAWIDISCMTGNPP